MCEVGIVCFRLDDDDDDDDPMEAAATDADDFTTRKSAERLFSFRALFPFSFHFFPFFSCPIQLAPSSHCLHSL